MVVLRFGVVTGAAVGDVFFGTDTQTEQQRLMTLPSVTVSTFTLRGSVREIAASAASISSSSRRSLLLSTIRSAQAI